MALGIGIIGTGFMGKTHALAWRNVKAVLGGVMGAVPAPRLELLCDTPDRAGAMAGQFGPGAVGAAGGHRQVRFGAGRCAGGIRQQAFGLAPRIAGGFFGLGGVAKGRAGVLMRVAGDVGPVAGLVGLGGDPRQRVHVLQVQRG